MNSDFSVRFKGWQFACVLTVRKVGNHWTQTVRIIGVGAAFDDASYQSNPVKDPDAKAAALEIALEILSSAGDLLALKHLDSETAVAERYRTWLFGRMPRVIVEPSGFDGQPALFVSAPRPYSFNSFVVADIQRGIARDGLPPRVLICPAPDGTLSAFTPE